MGLGWHVHVLSPFRAPFPFLVLDGVVLVLVRAPYHGRYALGLFAECGE